MKSILIIATFFTVLAFISAMPSETSSDLADMLRMFSKSSRMAMQEDYDYDDDDEDQQLMAQMMTSALMNSMVEGDEDSILASMMKGNEEEAVAQIRFIRRLVNRFRNSRIGQRIIGAARNRFCNGPRKN